MIKNGHNHRPEKNEHRMQWILDHWYVHFNVYTHCSVGKYYKTNFFSRIQIRSKKKIKTDERTCKGRNECECEIELK